eukprot:gnl/Dysnectes_brevis/4646_a6338_271.p1 GENE.gnl/Dysnectes_brevis/4646_a6338_271~~gnl/Dysnectes_brevis/4646_a6338_271.p1  ORF type:complete len:1069 (+),score=398.66 gnl/Dysnectes_brevis/4646_a6338_271:70-3276(+)
MVHTGSRAHINLYRRLIFFNDHHHKLEGVGLIPNVILSYLKHLNMMDKISCTIESQTGYGIVCSNSSTFLWKSCLFSREGPPSGKMKQIASSFKPKAIQLYISEETDDKPCFFQPIFHSHSQKLPLAFPSCILVTRRGDLALFTNFKSSEFDSNELQAKPAELEITIPLAQDEEITSFCPLEGVPGVFLAGTSHGFLHLVCAGSQDAIPPQYLHKKACTAAHGSSLLSCMRHPLARTGMAAMMGGAIKKSWRWISGTNPGSMAPSPAEIERAKVRGGVVSICSGFDTVRDGGMFYVVTASAILSISGWYLTRQIDTTAVLSKQLPAAHITRTLSGVFPSADRPTLLVAHGSKAALSLSLLHLDTASSTRPDTPEARLQPLHIPTRELTDLSAPPRLVLPDPRTLSLYVVGRSTLYPTHVPEWRDTPLDKADVDASPAPRLPTPFPVLGVGALSPAVTHANSFLLRSVQPGSALVFVGHSSFEGGLLALSSSGKHNLARLRRISARTLQSDGSKPIKGLGFEANFRAFCRGETFFAASSSPLVTAAELRETINSIADEQAIGKHNDPAWAATLDTCGIVSGTAKADMVSRHIAMLENVQESLVSKSDRLLLLATFMSESGSWAGITSREQDKTYLRTMIEAVAMLSGLVGLLLGLLKTGKVPEAAAAEEAIVTVSKVAREHITALTRAGLTFLEALFSSVTFTAEYPDAILSALVTKMPQLQFPVTSAPRRFQFFDDLMRVNRIRRTELRTNFLTDMLCAAGHSRTLNEDVLEISGPADTPQWLEGRAVREVLSTHYSRALGQLVDLSALQADVEAERDQLSDSESDATARAWLTSLINSFDDYRAGVVALADIFLTLNKPRYLRRMRDTRAPAADFIKLRDATLSGLISATTPIISALDICERHCAWDLLATGCIAMLGDGLDGQMEELTREEVHGLAFGDRVGDANPPKLSQLIRRINRKERVPNLECPSEFLPILLDKLAERGQLRRVAAQPAASRRAALQRLKMSSPSAAWVCSMQSYLEQPGARRLAGARSAVAFSHHKSSDPQLREALAGISKVLDALKDSTE